MADIKKKKIWILTASVLLVLCLLVGGMAIYVSDYYRADTGAITAFAAGNPVDRTVLSDGVIAYGSADAQTGFIFYPGGKVEYTAYEPLMHALASRGVLCVLIEMPFNLAVLDIDAADGVREQYPEVTRWYIGGHSLGGSMAASYLADHSAEFAGLVLLGAYSTADLSATSLEVLSLFGSEDRVMNAEKYEENKKNLPQGFAEIKIEGGCHAYFGMYGEQDGDGTPSISAEEQIRVTASHILDLMMKGEE